MEDVFETINSLVNVKEIIEFYHAPLNRANKVSCPFHIEKTPSLSVKPTENMWKCFGCGEGGDGISFVAKLKNLQQIDAAKLIANDFHLNISFDKPLPPAVQKIKDYIKECQKHIEETDYPQKRGLTLETMKMFGVGYDREYNSIVIPYSGSYEYYQTRSINKKGFFKPKTEDAGPEPIWNINALKQNETRPVFVVESPICAMSIMQYSGLAIALGGKENIPKLIETCKKVKFKAPLILCLDNDESGRASTEKLIAKLKDNNMLYVQYNLAGECKDPNDLLMKNPTKFCENIFQGKLQGKRLLRFGESELIDAVDLYHTEIEPLSWIAKDIIPEGLTILVAASKIGKSWMVMQLANAIVEQKDFLDKKTTKCGVLYFALEDGDRRLKSRMRKVWQNKEPSKGLHFKITAKTLDTGLIDQLTKIIKANPDIKLIVFDTLQKIRGSAIKNESTYAHDYREMGMLKNFADRYGISIILVHHMRKMLDQDDVFNMTSGSSAIIGAADTALIIYKKKRTDEFATLSLTGRDVRDAEIVISRSEEQGTWSVIGSPEEQEAKKKREEFLKNPVAQTLIALIKRQPSGWSGTVRQLVNACYDMYNAVPGTESAVGKMLQDYDFQNKIYSETRCEHSSKRTSKGVVHTFAPPQRTMWNEKYSGNDD